MSENEFDFENEIDIDLDNLHEEWRTHASKRYRYSGEVAHLDKVAKQQRKLIEVKKAKLKEAASKLVLQIKNEFPKHTVQQIDATIAGHEDIQAPEQEYSVAQDELIEIEYDLNMAKNAMQAFDDRKTALENEVKLWTRNYFSSPTEERRIDSRESGKSISAKGKDEASQNARKGMNRKRK